MSFLDINIKHFFEFFICLACFSVLAFLFPVVKQKVLRKGFYLDIWYWLIYPFDHEGFRWLMNLAVIKALGHPVPRTIDLTSFPLVFQVFIVLFVIDFSAYWVHRALHTKWLWRFHAIHHSPLEMDWMTGVRTHPVQSFLWMLPSWLFLINVKTHAFTVGWFWMAIGVQLHFIHANLNWSYGPLRYLFISPLCHRWHHTLPEEGGDKNFGAVFAIFDVIFGTFYMPQDKKPLVLGTVEPVPEGIWQQLIYPFRRSQPQVDMNPPAVDQQAV